MNMKYLTLTALTALALPLAAARADDIKLYSPTIENGEVAAEVNLNTDFDHRHDANHYFSQVYAAEYGINKYWKTEVGGEFERSANQSNKLTNLKWENIITPFAPGENWADIGFYLELEKAMNQGDPNNFEGKILVQKQVGDFVNLANIRLNRTFGPNHDNGTGAGFAWQTRYRYNQYAEPGIEYYADFNTLNNMGSFDEQSHQIGPVVQGKIGKVRYDTGLLFGVSKAAPDATAKLNLEYEF